MIVLELKGIEKYYGANLILKDINFVVEQNERVAIVGKNGTGKSTIFNIIAKEENYENGEILIKKGSKIGYLKQIPSFKNMKVKEVLNSAFKELNEIEKELRCLEKEMASSDYSEKLLNKYSKFQEKYEALGGYDKDTTVKKVCEGLSIYDERLNKDFDLLSGGEKTTVMLGKILIENPDLLLLDEPTNHLDMKAIEWLEDYLKEYKGTVVIISHDRYFLDKVVTKVVEIESLISTTYIGNYSSFINQKEENLRIQQHHYNEQQKEINRIEESIKQLKVFSRDGDNENFIKRAKSMQKRLDKMEKLDAPIKEKNMKLNINSEVKGSTDVVVVDAINKSFNNKVMLKDAYFNLRYGEKVALVGKNGCGKSTFIDIILGKIETDSGYVKLATNKSLGYLPQNIVFENEDITILNWFRGNEYINDSVIRQYLAKFMFTKENIFKKVGSLSGGEKSRLVISKMLYNKVNLLILDEPTNHLDIASIEVLEKALLEFKGTVIFISHDRYFINKISDKIVELENCIFTEYLGNYNYYKSKKEENIKVIKPILESKKIYTKDNVIKVNDTQKSVELKKKSESYMKKLEGDIANIENKISEIEVQLDNLGSNYEKMDILCKEKIELTKQLDYLLEKWIG